MFNLSPSQKFEFLVVDNFYEDPQKVREFALSLGYARDNQYFKGARSPCGYRNDVIGKRFQELMGKNLTKWDYPTNGVFQFCTSEDPLVYHMDSQQWAAVVYLTPDAPPEAGTSFFRGKTSKIRRATSSVAEIDETFKGGFYDRTRFDLVDTVGNVFNRLVIWDAKMIHAANQYFGSDKENSRLFQIFFFDAE